MLYKILTWTLVILIIAVFAPIPLAMFVDMTFHWLLLITLPIGIPMIFIVFIWRYFLGQKMNAKKERANKPSSESHWIPLSIVIVFFFVSTLFKSTSSWSIMILETLKGNPIPLNSKASYLVLYFPDLCSWIKRPSLISFLIGLNYPYNSWLDIHLFPCPMP